MLHKHAGVHLTSTRAADCTQLCAMYMRVCLRFHDIGCRYERVVASVDHKNARNELLQRKREAAAKAGDTGVGASASEAVAKKAAPASKADTKVKAGMKRKRAA